MSQLVKYEDLNANLKYLHTKLGLACNPSSTGKPETVEFPGPADSLWSRTSKLHI